MAEDMDVDTDVETLDHATSDATSDATSAEADRLGKLQEIVTLLEPKA